MDPRTALKPTGHDALTDRVDVASEITAALRARPIRTFDIGTAAVIGAAGVEGRVRVRIDDARWSLTTLEASVVAILVRLEPAMRAAEILADAFCLAAQQAENKVAAVHANVGAAA